MQNLCCESDCKNRKIGCHGSCEKYKKYVENHKKEQFWLRKMNNQTKINRSDFVGTSVKRQNKKNPLAYAKAKQK